MKKIMILVLLLSMRQFVFAQENMQNMKGMQKP
ncbi:hypothetical protein ACVWYN_003553, partial [Pedobacter sp. UYP24]